MCNLRVLGICTGHLQLDSEQLGQVIAGSSRYRHFKVLLNVVVAQYLNEKRCAVAAILYLMPRTQVYGQAVPRKDGSSVYVRIQFQ